MASTSASSASSSTPNVPEPSVSAIVVDELKEEESLSDHLSHIHDNDAVRLGEHGLTSSWLTESIRDTLHSSPEALLKSHVAEEVEEEKENQHAARRSSADLLAQTPADRRTLGGSLYNDVLHVIFRFISATELVACSCTNKRWRDATSKSRSHFLKWKVENASVTEDPNMNQSAALRRCLALSPLAGLMQLVVCTRDISTWDILPLLSRSAPRLFSLDLRLALMHHRELPQNIVWTAPKTLQLLLLSIDVNGAKCYPATGDLMLWTELQSVMEGVRHAPMLLGVQVRLDLGRNVSLKGTPMMPSSVWEPMRGLKRLKVFVWMWGETRTDLYWTQSHMDILRSFPRLETLSICNGSDSTAGQLGEFCVDALRMLTADPPPSKLMRLVTGSTRVTTAVAKCLVKVPLCALIINPSPIACPPSTLLRPLSRTLQNIQLKFPAATSAASVAQAVAECTKLKTVWVDHPNLSTAHILTMLMPLNKLTELSLVDFPSNQFLTQLPSLCERITILRLGHYYADTATTLPAMPHLYELGFGRRRGLPGRAAMGLIDPLSPQCDRARFPQLKSLLEILSMRPVIINPVLPQVHAPPQPPHPAPAPPAPPAQQQQQPQQNNADRCVLM